MFLAAFAAGLELSQMTKQPRRSPKKKGSPADVKAAVFAVIVIVIALLFMYFVGMTEPR
jgi:hypothetical protein